MQKLDFCLRFLHFCRMMNWDDARVILAVARAGSFAGAARTLRLDETTIARRLARAERALGAALFAVGDGQRRPTAAGTKAVAQCERLEEEGARLEALLRGVADNPGGTVRIAATESIARIMLAPAVGRFLADNPRLRLRLEAGPGNVSLARGEADLAIRMARPERGDLLVRKLADLEFAGYERKNLDGERRWLTYDEDLAHLPEARAIAGRLDGREPALRCNDPETLAAAASGGAGAVMLPTLLTARRWPELKRIEGIPVVRREVWLLMRPESRDAPPVRAAADWIVGIFKAFPQAAN